MLKKNNPQNIYQHSKYFHSLSLLALVCAAAPKVLVSHSETSDMLLYIFSSFLIQKNIHHLELPLLLLAVDAGQVHPVEPAVLLSLVPVGLQTNSKG